MIFLSDQSGNVLWTQELASSKFYSSKARIAKNLCLDGTVAVENYGVVGEDMDFTIDCILTEAQEITLKAIYESGVICSLTAAKGHYTGYISSLTSDSGNVSMTFLISDKVV